VGDAGNVLGAGGTQEPLQVAIRGLGTLGSPLKKTNVHASAAVVLCVVKDDVCKCRDAIMRTECIEIMLTEVKEHATLMFKSVYLLTTPVLCCRVST